MITVLYTGILIFFILDLTSDLSFMCTVVRIYRLADGGARKAKHGQTVERNSSYRSSVLSVVCLHDLLVCYSFLCNHMPNA